MSWQNNNGRSGNGPLPGSELEDMIQQGQQRFKKHDTGWRRARTQRYYHRFSAVADSLVGLLHRSQ